ncbi:hypothetical protein, partial [Thiolapillus sp.]|uniref:hypothetical protein n=1 Tax=Thiolapillus sp. TaxID=2017437 RepID=UPI003AF7635A
PTYRHMTLAHPHYHHHHQSLNREGRWCPPKMILQPVFSIFSLFSIALWDLPNARPVHSLMLSSHLFLVRLVFFPFSL